MNISIKSEMDSRPLLYPMLRALYKYGTVLVITNNPVLKRLIETPTDCGFRNITVLVDSSESADEICIAYGVAQGDYDFVIMDNVGASEVDVTFVAVGALSSEDFINGLNMMLDDKDFDCHIVQFGKPAPTKAASKEEQKARIAKEKEVSAEKKRSKDVVPEDYDPTEKFKLDSTKKDRRKELTVNVAFPSYQDIEAVEATYKFPVVSEQLIDLFYEALKAGINVEKRRFQREVRLKDESSGYVKSRDAVR